MMLFACGETSQLSTDSSTHNSESALQNAMIGSFNLNRTPSGSKRKRTFSTTSFINNNNQNNNNRKTKNSLETHSNNKPNTNLNTGNNRVLTLNLNDAPKTKSNESKRIIRQRTGSESILPSLRKFWEENFIDLGDNDKQIDYKSHTVCGFSAISLPNSPQNISKNSICDKDSVKTFYNESNYKVTKISDNSNAIETNDSLIDGMKDTRV
jgi:hypothetical protein